MRRNLADIESQSFLGMQEELVWDTVPVTAAQSLIGQLVRGSVLTVNGVYTCKVDIGGMTAIEAHLTATLAAATSTTSGGTTYNDEVTIKQAFAGVGAMVSATRQTITIAAVKGERFALIIVTIAAAGTATFTQGEINGS
jgi:hypothetical protein